MDGFIYFYKRSFTMGASSVTGVGFGAVERSQPRILNHVKSENLAVGSVNSSNIDNRPLLITTSTYTLDHADANKYIIIDRAAGSTITMPASLGNGDVFKFIVATTVTSNNITIKVANTSDVFVGNALMCMDGGVGISGFESSLVSGADSFVMNGTTTGGYAGDMMEIVDIKTNKFFAKYIGAGTSTEATPFASSVS